MSTPSLNPCIISVNQTKPKLPQILHSHFSPSLNINQSTLYALHIY